MKIPPMSFDQLAKLTFLVLCHLDSLDERVKGGIDFLDGDIAEYRDIKKILMEAKEA